jgi:hypothetical protein
MSHNKNVKYVWELEKKVYELEKELERIKGGIKRCDSVLIVDGNDMADWGWLTIKSVNKTCRKRWGLGISEYKK